MSRFLTLCGLIATAPWAVAADVPTFTKDIAPLMWKNCTGCHRTGEIGPFPLVTYQDAAKRAKFLVDVTTDRRMPPWKAEPGHGEFRDARRLSDAEIATISKWAAAGAPEGDPKALPEMPKFPEGWQLGEPDLVLKMSESFTVPGEGKDVLMCFVIPMGIDVDKMVSAWEFRPGNRKVVHHAILYTDTSSLGRARDLIEKGPGYRTFGGPGIIPSGGLGGWAPGAVSRFLPDGMGKYLKKGSDLVLQIHYHPTGKEESDQSQVGIYFAKKPVKQMVGGIALRSRNINIPAGKTDYIIKTQSEPLPTDAYAIGISPHMHYIGRTMKVTATHPDGHDEPMLWIKDWDFNWQGSYQYAKPVKLPKGTVLKLEALYDNSEANPYNPSSPPKPVKFGEQTTDEMCLLGIQIVTDTTADLKKIMTMKSNRMAALLIGAPPKEAIDDAATADTTPEKTANRLKSGIASPAGIPIPERFNKLLKRFDKNSDDRLSESEIDAMPPFIRDRVKKQIAEKLKEADPEDEPKK